MHGGGFARKVVDGLTMFIVAALSLLLLFYVGFGEGKRTYEKIYVDKLIGQGKVVQNSMENYLRSGLPLRQYVGFTRLAEPIVAGDDAIDGMVVYDQAGRQIFFQVDPTKPKLPEPSPEIKRIKDTIAIDTNGTHYQVILPLRTRFETVGSLVIISSVQLVDKRMDASFRPLLELVVGLSIAFAVSVSVTARHLARLRVPWLQIAYGLIFLTMAAALIGTLVSLYSDGVQEKAKSSAVTLAQRLNDYVEFNIELRDLEGLDKMFEEYRHLNPEISEAALSVDGTIQIDTQPAKVGKTWEHDPSTYEFIIDLSKQNQARRVSLAVAVPVDLVYRQVERSVKNFAALFVASAFCAGLFLQVASSMQRLAQRRSESDAPSAAIQEESALNIVKPIFFLAVFLESLTYSFLPQFMQDIARQSHVSLGFASLPFTAYYLCFALSLVPSGYFSDRHGPKLLIWSGVLISAASMLSLTLPIGIITITIVRALAGIGQGMLFIGIQTYILAVASPEKKTQANAIIVFGFQGGMISGMAIGSLLVNHIHATGVFWTSAAIGLLAALYTIFFVPTYKSSRQADFGIGAALLRVGHDLGQVLRSADFLKAMLFIGVPAKAILTGVITFALPLLLRRQGYQQEEIGQTIMLYGIGVVIASGYVSRLVDRTGRTALILFLGSLLSGLGLFLIGIMGLEVLGSATFGTFLVISGVVIVGLAHGFINAPVVTHIAHSKLAVQIGVISSTTTYRFLERLGHVAGPLLVGQCFLIWGESAHIIAWIGVMTAALGVFFIVRMSPPSADIALREVAQ